MDGRSESRTVALLAAQKVGRSLRWPLRKSDGRSAGRSESRTGAFAAAQKVGRSLRWPLRKSDGRSAGRSESWTLGDFEEVVTLGVAKASKPIFPIRGGRFLRVDGRSESRTVALLAAQKVGRSLRWPLKSRTLGDFEGVVTLGVAKASKPIFPIRGGRFLRGDAR